MIRPIFGWGELKPVGIAGLIESAADRGGKSYRLSLRGIVVGFDIEGDGPFGKHERGRVTGDRRQRDANLIASKRAGCRSGQDAVIGGMFEKTEAPQCVGFGRRGDLKTEFFQSQVVDLPARGLSGRAKVATQ